MKPKRRKRNYKNPSDGLDLLTAPILWLAEMIGKLWDRLRRKK